MMPRFFQVHIETLRPPSCYSEDQLRLACEIATCLQRGRLVLLIEPEEEE